MSLPLSLFSCLSLSCLVMTSRPCSPALLPSLSFLFSSVLFYSYFVLCCVVWLPCRVLSCLVLSCLVLSCLVLSCIVLSCFALSCLALSCLALSCLALSCECLVLFCRASVSFYPILSCFMTVLSCLVSLSLRRIPMLNLHHLVMPPSPPILFVVVVGRSVRLC